MSDEPTLQCDVVPQESPSTRVAANAQTAVERVRPSTAAPRPHPLRHSSIARAGRYVVLGELGAGGMGRVLRAYDPKLEREVALKELRKHRLGPEQTQRLVAEARAMAKLSHPNVVAVYDVDELPASGQLRLVMEFVQGQTIKAWFRKQSRPTDEIVRRFIDAGRGLAAAHAVGLLHRDFKPDNVLVASDGVVKVTDFGLARPADLVTEADPVLARTPSWDDPDAERLTQTGFVMGTPIYMPPEQHIENALLSAAADQYAFCVALWEALCGSYPFVGDDLLKLKTEGPPAWPQASTPAFIVAALRRGLAPQPQDRWPSLDALLAALEQNPARRRRRAALTMLGLGALGVLGWQSNAQATVDTPCLGAAQQLADVWDPDTSAASVDAALRATQVPDAAAVSARTTPALQGYASDWVDMHTEACEATAVAHQQPPAVMDLRMQCLNRAKVQFSAVVDVLSDADAEVAHRAHKLVDHLAPLSRCADVDALQADVEPPSPDEAPTVEALRQTLAAVSASANAGRYQHAKELLETAHAQLNTVSYQPIHVEFLFQQGLLFALTDAQPRAEKALDAALQHAIEIGQWDRAGDIASRLVFVVGYAQNRTAQGLRYHDLARGVALNDPLKTAEVNTNRALVFERQGRFREAEAEHRRVLALRVEQLGPDHLKVGKTLRNIASALMRQGQYREGEVQMREALAVHQRSLGANHPDVLSLRRNIAVALDAQGRSEEAEVEFRVIVGLAEVLYAQKPSRLVEYRSNLATALLRQGKLDDAVGEFRAALALSRSKQGSPKHHTEKIAAVHHNLGNTLIRQGKPQEAETEYRTGLQLCLENLDADHPIVAQFRTSLATALIKRGAFHEALPVARQAWARERSPDRPVSRRGLASFTYALALWQTGNGAAQQKAKSLARVALKAYTASGPRYVPQVEMVREWLEENA